jgi:hypothetical protein
MQGDFPIEERDGWVYANRIPLFDEHERDGIVFDFARLSKIVENNNKRIRDTGDDVPLVPGHVPEDKPEEQTQVLGWATNFTMGTWGMENPRACIFADLRFPLDKWEVAKNLPRRSIELWEPGTDNAFIDPIALLGATTPHRDLGLLYAKKTRESDRYLYEINTTHGVEMDKTEMAKCFAEMLENSDIGKYVREHMKASEEAKVEEPEAKHEDEVPVKSDEGEAQDDKEVESEEGDHKEDKPEEKVKEKYKLQRDQERRKNAKLESAVKELHSRLADLERRERAAARKADLLAIEAEGVMFDMAEELETVSDMSEAAYEKHLGKMRKRYSRSPVGVSLNVERLPSAGRAPSVDGSGLSEAQSRKVRDLIINKGMSKEEATNKVLGGI